MALPLILGLGSMILGGIQANQAKQQAKGIAAKQQASIDAANALERERYEDEKRLFGPIREKLAKDAMSDIPVGYARMAPQIAQQAEATRRRYTRSYGGGYGRGASGLAESRLQNIDLQEAAALTGAYDKAQADQRLMRMQVAGMDQSGVAASQYAQGLRGQADVYGRDLLAANADQAAGWGTFSAGVREAAPAVMDLWNTYKNKPVRPAIG